jgi:hypothetical protein
MYHIALPGWLWGVWGLLLSIPILGMVKVVSHQIEELHLVAELLKNVGVPPNDVVLSAHRRTPYLSIEFLNIIFRTIALFLRSFACQGMGITLLAKTFKLLLQDFQLLVG